MLGLGWVGLMKLGNSPRFIRCTTLTYILLGFTEGKLYSVLPGENSALYSHDSA